MEYAACAWRAGRGVCRCCLSEGCYKDIATEYYWMGERELYQDMLRECFDLTISYQDGGTNSNSRLICEVCITRLRDASNFKKQVINAEKRFAEHILTGSKLSDITEAAPAATFQEVKLEGVKDETGISDDDDMGADEAATDDPDYDPDYDESDMLPLKFEVQKKEALVEFSFGDEMPTLNTNETTIRRVSKSKGKSPSKKIKMSKKELTIKPIKASGSKVAKVPKAPKPAKVPVKKGRQTGVVSTMSKYKREVTTYTQKKNMGISALIENSNVTPFRWSTSSGHYQCFCCYKPYFDMQLLREHMRDAHTGKQIRLTLFREPNGKLMKVDIKSAACSRCSLPLVDLPSLKSHLTTLHNLDCDRGKNEFLVPFVIDGGTFRCQMCANVFNGFHALNQHMNVHFQNHVCDTCGAGFVSFDRLTRHVNGHKNLSSNRECKECNIIFTNKYKLEVHKSQFHAKKFRHKCPYCPERFKDHYLRTNHLSTVHGVPAVEYKCGVCDKAFARKGPLNAHVRQVHLKVRNHECDVCGHKFFQKSHLAKHMVSHSGQKNFHCEMCGKSYTLKNNLTHHIKIHHTDERKCRICSQVYSDTEKLKEHMLVHGQLLDLH